MDNYELKIGVEPTDKYQKAKQDVVQALNSIKQLNENDEYFSIYDFDEIDFDINQEQTVVKNVMKENHWTFELSKSLLSAPYEANNFKYNEVTETYIASVKISNDKMGIIKIVSTLMPEDKGNSLDTHQFKIEYIITPTYDNIIY